MNGGGLCASQAARIIVAVAIVGIILADPVPIAQGLHQDIPPKVLDLHQDTLPIVQGPMVAKPTRL